MIVVTHQCDRTFAGFSLCAQIASASNAGAVTLERTLGASLRNICQRKPPCKCAFLPHRSPAVHSYCVTRILLIGAGKNGRALVELFHKESKVELVGVADKDEKATGLELARELGLPVTTDYRELLAAKAIDLIVDVTGDPSMRSLLLQRKPPHAGHGTECARRDGHSPEAKPLRKPESHKSCK